MKPAVFAPRDKIEAVHSPSRAGRFFSAVASVWRAYRALVKRPMSDEDKADVQAW